MKVILYALLVSFAAAFAPESSVRPTTHLNENFGFDFAEDSYANQDPLLGGEANYKQWVNRVNDNSMLNRKVRNLMLGALCFAFVPVLGSIFSFYFVFPSLSLM